MKQQEFDFSGITGPDTSSTIDTITINDSTYSFPSIGGSDTITLSGISDYYSGLSITGSPVTSLSGGYITTTNGWDYINTTFDNNLLKVNGDTHIEGDLKIKGVSLSDRLDKIEERLAILRPNEDIESKWEELRELGNRYRELEKEIIEKEKVWDILKK